MSDQGQSETPMSDHISRFWYHLDTETVRILVDLKRTVGVDAPDGPVVYWDGASFPDDVAKALVAERDRFQNALRQIAGKNDMEGVLPHKCPSAAYAALHECELIARAALDGADR